MNDYVFLNDEYVTADKANISVFDRGFLFADAVYEVAAVLGGKLVDPDLHLVRLDHSSEQLSIVLPKTRDEIRHIANTLVARNKVAEGLVYFQVSRGAAPRDFAYPKGMQPTFIAFTMKKNITTDPKALSGLRIISCPDLRWGRCDIKTVSLLAAVMAKQSAIEAGYDDAWLVRDGLVTEGSSSNAFIIRKDRIIQTRQLGCEILPGITRRAVLSLAKDIGYVIKEAAFSIKSAQNAEEAFITSASSFVCPVIELDGQMIGSGQPGPITQKLRERYFEFAHASAIT